MTTEDKLLFARRIFVLVIMVASINTCWHFFRAWLPLFLQEARGYSESFTNYFTSAYYVATDVGCIFAGAATLWLARRGMHVHRARSAVYFCCALLTTLSAVVAILRRAG